MKFKDIQNLVETLQKESGTLIPYVDIISDDWQMYGGELNWERLDNDYFDWNYTAEIKEGVERINDYVIVNADIGTGDSVTFYLNASKEKL